MSLTLFKKQTKYAPAKRKTEALCFETDGIPLASVEP